MRRITRPGHRGESPELPEQIVRERVGVGRVLRTHAQDPERTPADAVVSEINHHTAAMPIYRTLVLRGEGVFPDGGGAASV